MSVFGRYDPRQEIKSPLAETESSKSRNEYLRDETMVVADMLSSMYGALSEQNVKLFAARAIKKTPKQPVHHAASIVMTPDIHMLYDGKPQPGVELALNPEDTAERLQPITSLVGRLSLSMLLDDHGKLHRAWIKTDDGSISLNQFVEDVWSPDYSLQLAEAAHLDIRSVEGPEAI